MKDDLRGMPADLSAFYPPPYNKLAAPKSGLGAYAHVIRATRHRRGTRSTQPDDRHTKARLVFIQEVLIPMFPRVPPKRRPRGLLTKVHDALAQNPEWVKQEWEPISDAHLKRAWKAFLTK
jgi:hypothetical protein